MLTIRGPNGEVTELDVDVRAEIEEYDWRSATWTTDKLVSASPFRYERNPSFAVIFEHGGWRDYGATDPEWQSGNFIRLLSFLRRETFGETTEYILTKYGKKPVSSDDIILKMPKFALDKPKVVRIGSEILNRYNFRSPYLAGRGISENVQQLMRIGYDRQRRAITIPWFNPDGSLGNVKYRRVGEKTFWYASGGRPIREMLYSIDVAYRRKLRSAAIVEAEVDALTLMTAGIFAIATGGTSFTAAKRDLIIRSPIEELTLYRDNDAAGRAWRNRIISELSGYVDLRIAPVPIRYGKDVNAAVVNGWQPALGKVETCRTLSVNIR